MFFEMKNIVCDFSNKAQNTEWMSDFAFATDIMQKMNELVVITCLFDYVLI